MSTAKLAPLPHGVIHHATVMAIQDAAESFPKGGTNITMFCHFISVTTNTKEGVRLVKLQHCNEHKTLDLFSVNDEITYTTSKYVEKFDRYTMASFEVVKSAVTKRKEAKGIPATVADDLILATAEDVYNADIDAAEGKEFGQQWQSKQTTMTIVETLTPAQQMMAQAQRNAALFYQMTGNVNSEEFLKFADTLYDQIKKAK